MSKRKINDSCHNCLFYYECDQKLLKDEDDWETVDINFCSRWIEEEEEE